VYFSKIDIGMKREFGERGLCDKCDTVLEEDFRNPLWEMRWEKCDYLQGFASI
jgi:hypothetical protein